MEKLRDLPGLRPVSRHHVMPRNQGGTGTRTAKLCDRCHSEIHRRYTNRQLIYKPWKEIVQEIKP